MGQGRIMSHPKEIEQRNKAGQKHGYCEHYFINGQLAWKGAWVTARRYGYHVDYNFDGKAYRGSTGYYFNGKKASKTNEKGYCLIWGKVVLL